MAKKKGDRTAEKGAEKLRHGNQQRRKRGMATTKQRDRRDTDGGNRKKGYNGKKKERRRVHLKTQHGRQEENGWARESKMEIVEKKLLKAETDGQFDSGRKRKKDRKPAQTDI